LMLPTYPNALKNTLIQVWIRLTKTSFLDHDSFKNVHELVMKRYLDPIDSDLILLDDYHIYLRTTGLMLFYYITMEMNVAQDYQKYSGQHHKIAIQFRDTQLLSMLKTCLSLIRFWLEKRLKFVDYAVFPPFIETALMCIGAILNFDFSGTNIDESTDETGTLQIPSSWRHVFEEGLLVVESTQETNPRMSLVSLFYTIYCLSYMGQTQVSVKCMECLSLIASVRRSLFLNEARRAAFIQQLLGGMIDLLQNHSMSLRCKEIYHEVCRFLARFKMTYQISELVADSGYQQWIMLVGELTIPSFRSLWLWSPASLSFLLTFWSRMVTSVAYMTEELPHGLEAIVPPLCHAFMQSIWDLKATYQEISTFLIQQSQRLFDEEEFIDAIEHVKMAYESFGILARFQYKDTMTHLKILLEMLKQPMTQLSDEYFRRVSWVINLVTACLSCAVGHHFHTESDDAIDGELAAHICVLVSMIDTISSNLVGFSSYALYEQSIMAFFEEMKKMFIGDSYSTKLSRAYQRLAEIAGLTNQEAVLEMVVQFLIKIIQNPHSLENSVVTALRLCSDLTCGYSTLRIMVQLKSIQRLIEAHKHDELALYSLLASRKLRSVPRHHILFYQILGRLLLLDEKEAPETEFNEFISPFTTLAQKLASSADQELRQQSTKSLLLELYADFRGLAYAMNDVASYNLFLQWYLATFSPITHRLGQLWMMDETLSIAMLRFMNELAQNRSQRIKFDLLSASGILLFRNISKVVVTYSQLRFFHSAVVHDGNSGDLWRIRYKGLHLCLDMFRGSLSGKYVPFGVFALYGDPVLDEITRVTWNMLLATPLKDLLAYPKLANSFFLFMESFTKEYLCLLLPELDDMILSYIFASIGRALSSVEKAVSSSACNVLDDLLTISFKNAMEKKPHFINSFLESHPKITPYFLRLMFYAIVYEDSSSQLGQWSYSRPLLVLILLNEKVSEASHRKKISFGVSSILKER
jgi:exportin-7